jgi:hypothetical protein
MLTKQDLVNEELTDELVSLIDQYAIARWLAHIDGRAASHAYASGFKSSVIKRLITLTPGCRQSWLEAEISRLKQQIDTGECLGKSKGVN